MDQFEKQFEDMDVQSEYMEKSMNQTTALTTPQEQVDELITMTADEHNIDLRAKFSDLQFTPKQKQVEAAPAAAEDEKDELMDRLAKLKN
jgi:charged multivesicular body protein 1